MSSALNLYQSVIQDVINNVKDKFLDESVDENVLQELKTLWEKKLDESKTLEVPQRPAPVRPSQGRQHHQQQQQGRQAGPGAQPHLPQNLGLHPGLPIGQGQAQPHMGQHYPAARPMTNGMERSVPEQHVIIDPNSLMPVQITIPAQPGNPSSVPRALTVHVPGHALQPGSQASVLLQQTLTQAITQALNQPDPSQATHFLQAHINSAFRMTRH